LSDRLHLRILEKGEEFHLRVRRRRWRSVTIEREGGQVAYLFIREVWMPNIKN
jgi:hypothetical protein